MLSDNQKEQGQKLVLSDALAVQSQGPKVSSLKVVMGSKKVHWDLKKCIEISKNTLRSQKMLSDLKQCFGISKKYSVI